MGWLELAGAFVTGGVAGSLLTWWKEETDRKARKTSYHVLALLKQADAICGMAHALKELVRNKPVSRGCFYQASLLWTENLGSLLNVWLANAWILDRQKNTKLFRQRFPQAVEALCQHAIAWYDADLSWRTAVGMTEGDAVINPAPCDKADVRRKAAEACLGGIETFLGEFQALHNALQPLVREYTSAPEAASSSRSDG